MVTREQGDPAAIIALKQLKRITQLTRYLVLAWLIKLLYDMH